jgi:hypothetical protein
MAQVVEIVEVPDTPETLRSIQGERADQVAGEMWATDDQVDEFVRSVGEWVLVCRERGRHAFAPVRVTGMRFEGVTPDGLFIRRVSCDDCGMVVRVELWEVRQKRGVITRVELVSATLDYTPGYLGKPGTGRMRPRQIRNAVASLELSGQNFREIMKAARQVAVPES